MSDVTLAIEDEILKKIRKTAVERNTSLTVMARDMLKRMAVREDLVKEARLSGRVVRRAALMGGCGALAALLAGCGPADTELARTADELRQLDFERRSYIRDSIEARDEEQEALRLVKAAPAPDNEPGHVQDWLRRTMDEGSRSVLFPTWSAKRAGIGKFMVRFQYSYLDERNAIRKRGFIWQTDLSLKTVSGPREMTEHELQTRLRPTVGRPPAEDPLLRLRTD